MVLCEHAQWGAAINALMIVASPSDSLCSERQRGKGVSERRVSSLLVYIQILLLLLLIYSCGQEAMILHKTKNGQRRNFYPLIISMSLWVHVSR